MPGPRLRQPAALEDLLLYQLSRVLSVGGSMVIRLCEGRFGAEGRKLYGALFPLVCEINRNLLAPLSAAEVQGLASSLAALQQQAERMVQAAELPKADRRRGGRGRLAMA